MIFKKNTLNYKLFEKTKIDLTNVSESQAEISVLSETDKYYIVKYLPKNFLENNCVLAQLKTNPKVTYMCSCDYFNGIVFNDYLFLYNEDAESLTKYAYIYQIDLKNKNGKFYDFRNKYGVFKTIMNYGRIYTSDHYLDSYINNNELIINVHREKADYGINLDNPDNCNMDYQIVFKNIDGQIEPYFRNGNIEFKLLN